MRSGGWVIRADEWEREGDEVVVRAGMDYHRLIGEAAATWLRLAGGKAPKRSQAELAAQLVALGLVERS